MNVVFVILSILSICFLFYFVIPAVGAYFARERWRRFREKLIQVSLYPVLDYADLNTKGDGLCGNFRFFGNLEAIQGEDRIWLSNGTMTIAVDLQDVSIYLIPSYAPLNSLQQKPISQFEDVLPYQETSSIKWKRIFSLPEGTQLFVGGALVVENGRGVFTSTQKEPLLVAIYEGEKKEILKRAIWCGRQKNEYWNQFTLVSLVTGFFSLLVFAYILLQSPGMRIPAFLSLNLSLLPLAIFLPPGLPLFFAYRFLWKKARYLRAERDLLQLPLRYFRDHRFPPDNGAPGNTVPCKGKEITMLPDKHCYIMIRNNAMNSASFLPVQGNVKIRKSSLSSETSLGNQEYFLFGEYHAAHGPDDTEYITEPQDPMAELIQIPGNPEELAARCDGKARLYTFFSGFFILVDLLLNCFLLFLLLQHVLR
ncbi:MAG: hypothetical protein JW881_16990 [Spirochaetales bacterium]|nr:hypothetical protein [Spirochaetales bacterium]